MLSLPVYVISKLFAKPFHVDYDIYLLDINMLPIGGLEIARKIRQFNKNAYIAFITGYIDYAMEGYHVDAIRYILKDSLEEMLKQADAGFTETLLKLIDKTGKKDSEIYKKANLSKQHFSKIRNNPDYKPTKQTAIALALALELDLEQTKDLIGRAGYALSNSSKFDLIIRYFIEQKNYNVVEINIALYEFDQSLLGS